MMGMSLEITKQWSIESTCMLKFFIIPSWNILDNNSFSLKISLHSYTYSNIAYNPLLISF